MHNESVGDSRSNTTDNAVGVAADGNDVIMVGTSGVDVANRPCMSVSMAIARLLLTIVHVLSWDGA